MKHQQQKRKHEEKEEKQHRAEPGQPAKLWLSNYGKPRKLQPTVSEK